jgi:hypothetical protein
MTIKREFVLHYRGNTDADTVVPFGSFGLYPDTSDEFIRAASEQLYWCGYAINYDIEAHIINDLDELPKNITYTELPYPKKTSLITGEEADITMFYSPQLGHIVLFTVNPVIYNQFSVKEAERHDLMVYKHENKRLLEVHHSFDCGASCVIIRPNPDGLYFIAGRHVLEELLCETRCV